MLVGDDITAKSLQITVPFGFGIRRFSVWGRMTKGEVN